MKTLQEIKEEYAKEIDNGSFSSWSEYRSYNSIHEEDLEIISKMHAKYICHVLANDAIRHLNKNRGSNDVAEFVDKWLENNLK